MSSEDPKTSAVELPPKPPRKWLRWRSALGWLLLLVLILGGGAVAWLKSASGEAWLRAKAEQALNDAMVKGRAELVGLRNRGLGELSFDRLRLSDEQGLVLEVEQSDLSLRLWPLLRGNVRVGHVAVGRLHARLELQAGSLNLQEMFARPEDESEDDPLDYSVDHLSVEQLEIHYTDGTRELVLDKGRFVGRIESTDEGVLVSEASLSAELEGEPFSVVVQGAQLGETQRVRGLAVDGMESRLRGAGRMGPEGAELTVSEAFLDGDSIGEILDIDWQENVVLSGFARQGDGSLLVESTLEVLGGELDLELSEHDAVIQGSVDFRHLDLGKIREDLGEEAVLTGKLRLRPSPREAAEMSLAVEQAIVYDELVKGIQADWVLGKDSAEVQYARLEHDLGEAVFRGEVSQNGLSGDLEMTVPRMSKLEAYGLSGFGGNVQSAGRLDVGWVDSLDLDFEGTAEGHTLGLTGGLFLEHLEGPLTVRMVEERVRAEGGFKGRQGEAGNTDVGEFFGAWQVDWEAGSDLEWEADLEAENLRHEGLSIGQLSTAFVGTGGRVSGGGEVVSVGFRHLRWPTGQLDVQVEESLSVSLALKDENANPWGAKVVQDSGTFSIESLEISPKGGTWALKHPGVLRWGDLHQSLEQLEFESTDGENFYVEGERHEEGLRLAVRTSGLSLEVMDTILGSPGHTGVVTADLELEKTSLGPLFRGSVGGRKLLIPGLLHGARLDLQLQPEESGQGIRGGLGRGKKSLLGMDVIFPVGAATDWVAWDGGLEGEVLMMASDNRVWGNVLPRLEGLPKGWTASRIELAGTPRSPVVTVDAGFEWMLREGPEFFRGDLSLTHQGKNLALNGSVRQAGRPMMRIKGNLETGVLEALSWMSGASERPPLERWDHWWQDGQVRVLSQGLDLVSIRPLLPFSVPVEGLLSGSFLVEGNPSRPWVSAGLSLSEGRMGEVDLPVAMVSLNPGDGGYDVFSYSRMGDEEFRVDGRIELDLVSDRLLREKIRDEALVLKLNGAIPLPVFRAWTQKIDGAEGAILVSGEIGGSLVAPKPDLRMSLEKGRFNWIPEGIAIRNLSFEGIVKDGGVRVPRYVMRTSPLQSQGLSLRDHESRLSGSLSWPFESNRDASFELTAEDAWLMAKPGRVLRLDGGLSAEGTPEDLDIRGSLQINEGLYELTPEQWLAEDALMLDPAIHLNRRIETLSRVEEVVSESSDWNYSMDIDLGQNTWIDAEIPLSSGYGQVASKVSSVGLEGRLDGVLRAESSEEGLVLQGEVDVRKGKAKVFGTEFDVETGDLVFSGAAVSSPELDIRAVYSSTQYGDIRVDIGGRPAQMALAFSSSEGWSDTDMASILLFKVPASSMTQSEGGAGLDLIGAAIGVMAGQASSFLQMSRLVDRVEVESSGDTISAIRLGWSVGDDLFVTFSQDYTAEMDENQSEVTLEWLLSRRLQAEVSTGDAGESSADLYMRWRF